MSSFSRYSKRSVSTGIGITFLVLIISYYCYHRWQSLDFIALPIPECDLRNGPCLSTLPTGESIELHIKPTHMPVLTSVQLRVKTQKIRAKKIFIDFKGTEMNMGEFRYNLELQKDGYYSTQTILPTCIHEQMIWQAVVHVESSNKHYHAAFVFTNQKPV